MRLPGHSNPHIYQLVAGASPGDAIYDHACVIQDTLRAWGYSSRIYAGHVHHSLARQIPHFNRCHPHAHDVVFFHYSIGSELSAFVRQLRCKVVLVYHNVTPPQYFAGISQELAQSTARGIAELTDFRDVAALALADSEFNRRDLLAAGFTQTGILPIALNEAQYAAVSSHSLLEDRYRDGKVNLLFVGRITPNKCQDDLIKVFYHYHRIQPDSRLFLVGQSWDPAGRYLSWVQGLVSYLGLQDHVCFTGHVSFEDMVAYYRLANVFVSMSEHEGFCKPLLESMYFELPIVAYAAAAVPGTLGDAGVLVHQKDYPLIAELLDLLVRDPSLRAQLLAGQRRRFAGFRQEVLTQALRGYVDLLSSTRG